MDARVNGDANRRSDAGLRRVAIGSYNVHKCVGWDRRRAPSRIAAVLKELDCDIYALQEVDNEEGDGEDSMQLEYLSQALEMAAVPGLRIVRHSGQYGNALLTRLPIVSVHRHDLSYWRFEPRGALDVQLTPDHAAQLDRVSPWGGMIVPYYLDDGFADFRPHRYRW